MDRDGEEDSAVQAGGGQGANVFLCPPARRVHYAAFVNHTRKSSSVRRGRRFLLLLPSDAHAARNHQDTVRPGCRGQTPVLGVSNQQEPGPCSVSMLRPVNYSFIHAHNTHASLPAPAVKTPRGATPSMKSQVTSSS